MGLFDDLPAPAEKQENKLGGEKTLSVAASQSKNKQQSLNPGRSLPPSKSALAPSFKKSSETKAETPAAEADASAPAAPQPSRRRVRFHSLDEALAAEEAALSAIARLTPHIRQAGKAGKAAQLALQLLQSQAEAQAKAAGREGEEGSGGGGGGGRRRVMDAFFQLLQAAMEPPQRASDPGHAAQFRVLLEGAEASKELFTSDQQQQLAVWSLWAVLLVSLRTDDSFEFARATGAVQKEVEALPAATAEDEQEEMGRTGQDPASQEEPSVGEREPQGAAEGVPGGSLAAEEDAPDTNAAPSADEEAEDPFGLAAVLAEEEGGRRKRKREEKERQMQRVEWERGLLRLRREALLSCVQTAADMYKNKWAQTAVDLLVKHAYDNRDRFLPSQQFVLQDLWFRIRDKQFNRKHGKKDSGKRDLNAFERLEKHYASEDMSIRKGVGSSGGRASVTWLG